MGLHMKAIEIASGFADGMCSVNFKRNASMVETRRSPEPFGGLRREQREQVVCRATEDVAGVHLSREGGLAGRNGSNVLARLFGSERRRQGVL